MHPWLLQHPPVPTYGVCLLVALIAGWLLTRRLAVRNHLDPSHIDLLIPVLLASALAGAWLLGRATDLLTATPTQGFVLIGALLLGTGVGILFARFYKIPLGLLGDTCAPAVALVIAGGRLGCFFAGCCYGTMCYDNPLALHFPAGSFAYLAQIQSGLLDPAAPSALPVWPVQLAEATACLALALLLWRFATRTRSARQLPGECFLALGLAYALIRFILEFFRADNPPIAGGLTFSQLLCIGILPLTLTTALLRRRFAARWRLTPLPPPNGEATGSPAASPQA